ncbi:hypothetical protein, partial [Candidatus Solincola tengchongensis]|uniref:hypothetical protein n=1 Tax=Candidatus Solincola tengchongensis TaxID=2900693 RepID=UPI00257A2D16
RPADYEAAALPTELRAPPSLEKNYSTTVLDRSVRPLPDILLFDPSRTQETNHSRVLILRHRVIAFSSLGRLGIPYALQMISE